MMGAAVLITLGVLFLMENYGMIPFDRSFPVLLLVIGCVMLVSRTGSLEGHIQPGWNDGVAPVPPPAPQPWTGGTVPPPPPTEHNDSQVKP
jgi:hypothetical protein